MSDVNVVVVDGSIPGAGHRPRPAVGRRRTARWSLVVVAMLGVASIVGAPLAAGASSAVVAAHMADNSITLGQSAHVVGSVTPARATPRVVVQRRINGHWGDRNAGLVALDGSFDIAIRPTQAGIYALRVRSNGGSVVSATFYLRVRPDLNCPDPETCVQGLFSAWKAGNQAAAAAFADAAAVQQIFAQAYDPATGWASAPVQAFGGDPAGQGFEWLSSTQHELDFGVKNLNYPNLPQGWQVQTVTRTLSGEGTCDTVQACATSLFGYWQAGDRTLAQFIATPAAVTALFAHTYTLFDRWAFQGCSGVAGGSGCTWTSTGHQQLQIVVSDGTGNTYPAPPPPPYQVVGVSFS